MTESYVDNKEFVGHALVAMLEEVHKSSSVKGKKIKRFYLGTKPYFVVEYIGYDSKELPKQRWDSRGGQRYGTILWDFAK